MHAQILIRSTKPSRGGHVAGVGAALFDLLDNSLQGRLVGSLILVSPSGRGSRADHRDEGDYRQKDRQI
jgi:hypothetical protein